MTSLFATLVTKERANLIAALLAICLSVFWGAKAGVFRFPCLDCNEPNFAIQGEIVAIVESMTLEVEGCYQTASYHAVSFEKIAEYHENAAATLDAAIYSGGTVETLGKISTVGLKKMFADIQKKGRMGIPDGVNMQDVFRNEDSPIRNAKKEVIAHRAIARRIRKDLEENSQAVACSNKLEMVETVGCGILLLEHIPSKYCYLQPTDQSTIGALQYWYALLKEKQQPYSWCLNYWNQTFPELSAGLTDYIRWRETQAFHVRVDCEEFFGSNK
jgi:hypothetical protein